MKGHASLHKQAPFCSFACLLLSLLSSERVMRTHHILIRVPKSKIKTPAVKKNRCGIFLNFVCLWLGMFFFFFLIASDGTAECRERQRSQSATEQSGAYAALGKMQSHTARVKVLRGACTLAGAGGNCESAVRSGGEASLPWVQSHAPFSAFSSAV